MNWSLNQATDIGGRAEQQDAAVIFKSDDGKTCFALVADGVGGHRGGRVASMAVAKVAEAYWEKSSLKTTAPAEFLAKVCEGAHKAIHGWGVKHGANARSTVVAVIIHEERAVWAHSGDSRLYWIRDGKVVGRTTDHSLPQLLCDRGDITEAEMKTHPDRNRLLQCLGGGEYSGVRFGEGIVQPGDGFVLCSDGVWDYAERADFESLMIGGVEDSAEACAGLIKRVLKGAGAEADNATVVLVRETTPAEPAAVVLTKNKSARSSSGILGLLSAGWVRPVAATLAVLIGLPIIWAVSNKENEVTATATATGTTTVSADLKSNGDAAAMTGGPEIAKVSEESGETNSFDKESVTIDEPGLAKVRKAWESSPGLFQTPIPPVAQASVDGDADVPMLSRMASEIDRKAERLDPLDEAAIAARIAEEEKSLKIEQVKAGNPALTEKKTTARALRTLSKGPSTSERRRLEELASRVAYQGK